MNPTREGVRGHPLIRTAAVCAIVGIAAARFWFRFGPHGGQNGPSLLGEVMHLAPFALAFLAGVVLVPRVRGFERRFWGPLAAATGLWFAAETYFSLYLLFVDARGPALPAPFELLYVGSGLALIVMFVGEANFGNDDLITRIRFFVGAFAGLVAMYVVSYDLLAVPLLGGAGFTPSAIAVAAVYPVAGVALAVSTLGIVFGRKVHLWRDWQRFAVGGLCAGALALAVMPWWLEGLQSASTGLTMAVSEAGLVLAPSLLFLAAVFRLTSSDDSDGLGSRPRIGNPAPWLHLAYPVALSFAVPAFGIHAMAHVGTAEAATILTADVVLAALLLSRSWLSSLELQRGRRASGIDEVTSLKDERLLKRELEADVAEAKRWRGDVALIALDVDDLTRVNDLFGHASGDGVLRAVAATLGRLCDETCDLYRAGSDEFVIIAPGQDSDAARRLAEASARQVEREVACGDLPISVTAGVSTLALSGGAEAMIRDGFSALQSAKINRRGSVVVYGPDTESPQPPEERLELALKEAYRATVRALAAAVDARDPASRSHSRTVATLARELAVELGADAAQASAIETAALVHDIGKLALPDELLWKQGSLDQNEMARLREHVEIGERILRSTELGFILPWVRAHHERWDGAGYPDGISGEDIPLEARVLAVCDAYDAMTSGRAGSKTMGPERALAQIRSGAGTQFDPQVADSFIRLRSRPPARAGQADGATA